MHPSKYLLRSHAHPLMGTTHRRSALLVYPLIGSMSSYPNLSTTRVLERDAVFLFDVVSLMYNVTCQMISVPPDPPSFSSHGAVFTGSYTYNTVSTIYGFTWDMLYRVRKGSVTRQPRQTSAIKIEQNGRYGKEGKMVEGNVLKAKGCRQVNREIN